MMLIKPGHTNTHGRGGTSISKWHTPFTPISAPKMIQVQVVDAGKRGIDLPRAHNYYRESSPIAVEGEITRTKSVEGIYILHTAV